MTTLQSNIDEEASGKESEEEKPSSWRKGVAATIKASRERIFRPSRRKSTEDSAEESPQQHTGQSSTSLTLSESSFRSFPLDTPARRWLSSFGRSDPRWQILNNFQDVAAYGGRKLDESADDQNSFRSSSSLIFHQASVFTVWRPTSAIAIRRMIAGEATGKGLELKGKSAKAGKLSGYVPYLQIHQEEHKQKVRTLPRGGRVRIFYATLQDRDAVMAELEPLQNQMLNAVHDAKRIVKKTALTGLKPIGKMMSSAGAEVASVTSGLTSSLQGATSGFASCIGDAASESFKGLLKSSFSNKNDQSDNQNDSARNLGSLSFKGLRSSLSKGTQTRDEQGDEREFALKRLLWDMDDPSIRLVDDYAPKCYGIELPDRLLWQACVADSDISRPEGSDFFTARPSQPAFQDMNFISIYKTRKNGSKNGPGGPRVVLWQACGSFLDNENPLDPRGLIMAYEENGRVLPVVSDFDCFTVGTRGVQYENPLPRQQVELLEWCVSNIGSVLDKQKASQNKSKDWTSSWLEVLKSSSSAGFHPVVPPFGFGDGKSYSITEYIVSQLQASGAVRHGAECFNYYFPQELDEEFLLVCDSLPGKVPWKYVGVQELQDFLEQKVDDGFTFPLNPKWLLCDKGWKHIWDRLLCSDHPNVQDSLNVWYPDGVREAIQSIHECHPEGYICDQPLLFEGTEAMDLATLELDAYMTLCRAKAKLRAIVAFIELLQLVRSRGGGRANGSRTMIQNK